MGPGQEMITSNTYTPPINRKKWNTLFHCNESWKMKQLWKSGYKYGSGRHSRSSIEYTLSLYLWRKRLNEAEIVKVFSAWWHKHKLRGNFYRLRHFTIPQSFAFAAPYLEIIEAKYLEQRRLEQLRRRAKRKKERPFSTGDRIVEFMNQHRPVTAQQVAIALKLTPASISKRFARSKRFVKVGYGKFTLAGGAQ
jgi:hypothetical protein